MTLVWAQVKRQLLGQETYNGPIRSPSLTFLTQFQFKKGKKKKKKKVWLLGFEPRSPRPQRGILTTKLQPLRCCRSCTQNYLTKESSRRRDKEA